MTKSNIKPLIKEPTASKYSDLKLQYIDGVRREGSPETGYRWTILGGTTFTTSQKILYDSMTGKVISQSKLLTRGTHYVVGDVIRPERLRSYDEEIDLLIKANLQDAAEGIDVYLESIDEVVRRLGRKLVEIDIGMPNKYVAAKSFDELRANAKDLGASLLVNLRSAGEWVVATPVKYATTNEK